LLRARAWRSPPPLDDAVEADTFQDPVQDAGDELGHQVADNEDEQGGNELGHERGHIGPGVLDAAWKSTARITYGSFELGSG
jgi:hypothetical protein